MSAFGADDLCWESEAAVWWAEFDDIFLFGDAVMESCCGSGFWKERACEMFIYGGIGWKIAVTFVVE